MSAMSGTPRPAQFGVLGLGVMGENLALNIDDHGYRVALWTHTEAKVQRFVESNGAGRRWIGTRTLEEFTAALVPPRRMLLMVKAGQPVDEMLERLAPYLSPGDVVIDGGNSFFRDTQRREAALRARGVHFVGMGVSGGEEGALHVDNWRWAGVPFYVRTGKRLGRKMTEVRIHFRRPPQALFAGSPEAGAKPNLITLRIQPDEGITITFAAKQPGLEMRLLPVEAEFAYAKGFPGKLPDAYATLLLDAMQGDGTLFTRRDEVEAAWRIITPIEEAWAQLPLPRFPNYPAGSDGPPEVRSLMADRRHNWCSIAPKARQGAANS